MRALAIPILLALSLPAAAQEAPPAALPSQASTNPADAPAGTYRLDPRHANVTFRVRHTGVGIFQARFNVMAATLDFDPQTPTASTLDATVDANSVDTGVMDRNGEREMDFDRSIANLLGAGEHPQIRFTSRSATQTGPTTGLIVGDLTMNGQTHPATFEVTFQGGRAVQIPRGGKYVLAFSGRTIIDRRQWGVGSLVFNQFASDEVEIVVEGEFVQE